MDLLIRRCYRETPRRGRAMRRFFSALYVGVMLLFSGCGGGEEPTGPSTPPPPPPRATITGIGCSFQPSSLSGLQGSGAIYFPSGNATVDAFYQSEGLNLVAVMGLSPRAFFFNDAGAPNAYATPEVANALGPDGTILFGSQLFVQQIAQYPRGETVVAIMSHEFGHLMQYRFGFREQGKRPELHADFMAGWYLAVRGRYAFGGLSNALQVFYAIGDYQFNSPTHHGTPQERLAAATAGFRSAAPTAYDAYLLGLRHVGAP